MYMYLWRNALTTHTHTHSHSLTTQYTHTSYMTYTQSYGEIIQPHECETERVGGREREMRERKRRRRERQGERNMRKTGSTIH